MKAKNSNPLTVCSLFFLSAFVLNLTACKKDAMVKNQDQLMKSSNTQSRSTSSTTSEKINTDILVFIPCADEGAGEYVQLSGILHVVTSVTINGNNVRGKTHFQPQGISGVGMVTGDKYNATGVTQDEFKGSLVNGKYEETFVNNFRIIGQGSGNNFLIHEIFHVTINANGEVTTVFDKIKSDCK